MERVMVTRKRAIAGGKAHNFGGDWTATKLDVLGRYLSRYTTVLRNKPSPARPFQKAYIDAFAGSGSRTTGGADDATSTAFLFPNLAEPEPQQLLDGSARIALKTQPRFDRYVFIERNPSRCCELEDLKAEFPELAGDIRIKQGEANEEIQALCQKEWSSHRAVLFLDPYGMEVEWKTIDAISRTEAIDLWLLFPLGVGVNRLLTRSGDIPPAWRAKLNKLFGTQDWYDKLYRVEAERDLWGAKKEHMVKATTEAIGRYFVERLKSVFPHVADEPGVLRNSANCPLYLLCFAAGNKNGGPTALRIASHLLKWVR
jgi:three-Cys-motif partner protein